MATPAYVSFVVNSKALKGSSIQNGKDGSSLVISFKHAVFFKELELFTNNPIREHHPLSFLKELDSSSVTLYQYMTRGTIMDSVTIDWYQVNEKTKKDEIYLQHILERVKISSIGLSMPNIKDRQFECNVHMEEVTLRYDKITWFCPNGYIRYTDRWNFSLAFYSGKEAGLNAILEKDALTDEFADWFEQRNAKKTAVKEIPKKATTLDKKTARRARLVGMLFDANKCFLLPQGLPGIKTIIDMHKSDPKDEVLIVGHAGSDEDLAGADIAFDRAEIIGAYLKSIPSIWLNWSGPIKAPVHDGGHGRFSSCYPCFLKMVHHFTKDMHQALPMRKRQKQLKAFRSMQIKKKGLKLPVDGKANFETRKAIIEAYMGISDTTLAEDVIPVAHGCEGHFEDSKTASGVASDDRRLEVFFFKNGISPRPDKNISAEGSANYPTWLSQVLKTTDFECHGIHVQIIDNEKQPAPFAKVALKGPTSGNATADEHGFVSFFGLNAGEYTISSEMKGYKIGVSKLVYPTAKTVSGFAANKQADKSAA